MWPRLLFPASNTREQWHAGNAGRLTAGAEDRQVSLSHSAWTSESPVFVGGANLKCNIMVEFPLLKNWGYNTIQKMAWQLLDCYSDPAFRRAWSWHVASGSWKEGQGGGSGMREDEEEERPLRSMTARDKSKMYRAVSSIATPNHNISSICASCAHRSQRHSWSGHKPVATQDLQWQQLGYTFSKAL